MSFINPLLAAKRAKGQAPKFFTHTSRTKQTADTIADARAKAIKLLRENLAYFQGGSVKAAPEPVIWKLAEEGQYRVGLKYANVVLKGWADGLYDGYDCDENEVHEYVDIVITDVEGGACDAALQKIIDANKARVQKILARKTARAPAAVVAPQPILSDYDALVQRMAVAGKVQA